MLFSPGKVVIFFFEEIWFSQKAQIRNRIVTYNDNNNHDDDNHIIVVDILYSAF